MGEDIRPSQEGNGDDMCPSEERKACFATKIKVNFMAQIVILTMLRHKIRRSPSVERTPKVFDGVLFSIRLDPKESLC